MSLKIKEMAKKRKMSIYKLAQEMNKRYGVAMSNVYDWTNHRYEPTRENLKGLCEILECNSQELLGW